MDPLKNFTPEADTYYTHPDKIISAFMDLCRDSTLGVLIKGIIHNLNGTLQILSMQVEMLQRMLIQEEDDIPAIQAKAAQCMEQIDQMKKLVDVLIQKGIHEEEEALREIDLNQLLEEELAVLKHNLFFKHQIRLKKELGSSLPPLKGYWVDFSRGILNLIQNAIEAMEGSSRKDLTIVTKNQGKQIQVMIIDTGCGIAEEIKPRLFKPFYSNKGEKHPGLGLFLSRELLARYGASFSYASGKGETTFSIHFPVGATVG